ncbi:unnamed protein product [Paramecium pentaurelia]|uniref:Uncharacterized protein n=1 Tax=Paramecium pentaurelia TaxID=43138 RepID=A0A8S1TZA2_9CILI|nr:unnamed protein product [Paramecium pentaurelia]
MIKFQNQPINYDVNGYTQPKYSQMPPKQQKQMPNQGCFQETFGQQQYYGRQMIPQSQDSKNYQQPQQHQQQQTQNYQNYSQKQQYPNMQQQQQHQQSQQQQQHQQSQQQQQLQQQKTDPRQNVQFTAKEFNQLFYKQQQQQQQQTNQNKANENQEDNKYTQPQKVTGNERQISTYSQNQQQLLQQKQAGVPGRMQSADPVQAQNRNAVPLTNIQNQQATKTSQYISNGGINKTQNDYSQRQATPMKDQMKFMNQKQVPEQINQQLMYSPMPKSQLLNETTNLAKLQQQQLQQNKSPQIQKVGGSGMGPALSQPTNAQQIVEELAKEKERHQLLTAKLKKLEQEKKTYNTQFLNEMENKIKTLIQQNDQLQNLNMELLQKAQDQPQGEIQELNKQISYNSQQLDFLQKQINEAQKQLSEQMKKYKDLEQQYQEKNQAEEQQIQYLVTDLEEKVHGLIAENERLNSLIAQQDSNPKKEQLQQLTNEKNKLISMTQQSQKEVKNWKTKYEQLQQKLQQADKFLEPQGEQVEALEEKIKSLIEENDYLNTVVQQQIERENQIALLEEEMQNLVEQNDNLEMLLQNSIKK